MIFPRYLQPLVGRCLRRFGDLPAIALLFLSILAATGSAWAARNTEAEAQICDAAARRASQKTGVPLEVLRAITRTETGRPQNGVVQPWPWTVNMEGIGKWFETEDDARAYVFQHFKRGARSFDVGCFQINYRWHGEAFRSIDEMFEPEANALYAATFLSDLYAQKRDWTEAAGAYHSNTPKYATRYKRRYSEMKAQLSDLPAPGPLRTALPLPRVNSYPLLQGGGTAARASLTPLGAGAAPFFSTQGG